MNKKTVEIYRKLFEIVPKGHHNCQLSTVNCQLNYPFLDFTQILHILVFLYMDLPTILHIIGIEKLLKRLG